MIRSLMVSSVVLIAGSVAATPAAPVASPLLPLTQHDRDKVDAMGCVFQFETNRNVMFYAIDNVMTVRTKAGAALCKPDQSAFAIFQAAKGAVTCGGQRLRLRPIGKQADHPESDGSSQPAALTIGTGKAATVLRGEIATAC